MWGGGLFHLVGMLFRAIAARRWLFSWDSELLAGAVFVLPVIVPAGAFVRAGERRGNSELGDADCPAQR